MARAMRAGSFASATPVFSSTPATPSSNAIATSDAVPTPASTMTGTFSVSTMMRMFCGFRMPWPVPMPEPSGITAAAPAFSK